MKELSIFIDESGDFGEYDYHSPSKKGARSKGTRKQQTEPALPER